MSRDLVLILDFGSQYTQLIARRIRELKVYSEIHPFNIPFSRIKEMAPKAIVLSGGPSSVYEGRSRPSIAPAASASPTSRLYIAVALRTAWCQ